VHYFKYANGELVARQQSQHKNEQTKRLAEEKLARLQRAKDEAAAAAAARKAAAEAKKKAAEAAA
jgi:electron transport complex protein RnfC